MEAVRQRQSTSYQGDMSKRFSERVRENSTELTVGGVGGLATIGTINQSTRLANGFVNTVKTSSKITKARQAQLLEFIGKFKPLAKFAKNPIVVKFAGAFAGLSSAATLIGVASKATDTCEFIKNQAA